jgi:hypothetical protein
MKLEERIAPRKDGDNDCDNHRVAPNPVLGATSAKVGITTLSARVLHPFALEIPPG